MAWHFHPFLLIPAFSAVLLTAWLAWFGWRRRPAAGAAAFALVMLAAAIWSAGNTLELGAADLPTKIFWLKFEYLGILLLPTTWLAFALQYTERGKWLTRRAFLIFAIEPIAMLLLLWTNDAHGLFFRHLGMRQGGGMLLEWDNVEGPLYWVNIAYSYCFIALGSFLLLQHLSRLPAPHSRRELVVVAGALLPLVGNALYNLYNLPIPGLDPTPFTLTLTGAAFAWGLFSLRLLDLRPAPAVLPEELSAWRLRVLEEILRGVFVIWLFALAGGIYNVVEIYQKERLTSPNVLTVLIGAIVVYVGVTLLGSLITFLRSLPYSLRAGVFLFILYVLGAVGLALASLSGDGRVFLFAFIVLSAIFFGLRFSLFAAALSLVTLLVMGWLQVSGALVVPAERQINSANASAWTNGILVFLILSVAALISITYLLRALESSLSHLHETLKREQRLTRIVRTVRDVNQLIVRERNPLRLLEQACEHLVAGRGYDFVWMGLLEADGVTLRAVASAGQKVDLEKFASRLDLQGGGPTCAVNALRARRALCVPEEDPCTACPMLPHHPQRTSLALPIIHEKRDVGALIVEHATAFFDEEETALLNELADDLAHALAALRAEEQQRGLAELSGRLLFARDEDMLWTEVIAAVQQILRAERVAIYRYDRETDSLSCPRSYGLSPDYVNELNRRFHEVPGSALLREPRPVVIQDVETEPSVAPLREWMLREGFRSYAVFPFYTSKGLYGAFTAYRNARGAFTASDLAVGETLVRMIGLALENMELNAETRRKASELGALYAAAQDMASSLLDSDALLLALARHVTETLNATSAYITSVDLEEKKLRVLSEYWSAHASPSERHSDLGRLYSLQDYPVFHRVLLSGKAEFLHADALHLSPAERLEFEQYGVHTILFLPVMAHGKILGGLEVWESRRKREFSLSEIILAQALTSHAASVIHATNLFAELEKREAHFRALIEHSAEGIAILDADGNFRYAAPAEERLTGFLPQELLGKSAFAGIHPEDAPRVLQAFQESTRKPGAIVTLSYRVKRKDGEWRYYEATGHNLLHDPLIQGAVINYRDVTERRQAEIEAQENAKRYQSLFTMLRLMADTMPDMLWAKDVQGRYLFANRAMCEKLLNASDTDEPIGKTDLFFAERERRSHPENPEWHTFGEICVNSDAIVLENKRAQRFDEFGNVKGEFLFLDVQKAPLYDADGNLIGTVGSGRIVTEEKAAQAKIQRQAEELAQAYDSTLEGWARALELRDKDTEGHTRRVTDLTLRLARAMGLSEEQIIHIRRGAILHDIGKVGIPDAILHKTGPLTAEEEAFMHRHPQFAFDMLSPIEFLRLALDIPWCHHEKWDGSGYPRGLKGEEIPLAARIFAVADVWDALTSDRPYRPAWTEEQTLAYLSAQTGKHFDPKVIEVFFSLHGK